MTITNPHPLTSAERKRGHRLHDRSARRAPGDSLAALPSSALMDDWQSLQDGDRPGALGDARRVLVPGGDAVPGAEPVNVANLPAKGIARIAMQLVEPGATTDAGGMVAIDDQSETLGPPWDVLALVASGREQGGYYLGNCDCGPPRCAGVWFPVQVRHEDGQVTWTVPQPYDTGMLNKPGTGRKSLAFDATQYRAQAAGLLEAMRQLPKPSTLCCYPTDRLCDVIAWADSGGADHGGREDLPD